MPYFIFVKFISDTSAQLPSLRYHNLLKKNIGIVGNCASIYCYTCNIIVTVFISVGFTSYSGSTIKTKAQILLSLSQKKTLQHDHWSIKYFDSL